MVTSFQSIWFLVRHNNGLSSTLLTLQTQLRLMLIIRLDSSFALMHLTSAYTTGLTILKTKFFLLLSNHAQET